MPVYTPAPRWWTPSSMEWMVFKSSFRACHWPRSGLRVGVNRHQESRQAVRCTAQAQRHAAVLTLIDTPMAAQLITASCVQQTALWSVSDVATGQRAQRTSRIFFTSCLDLWRSWLRSWLHKEEQSVPEQAGSSAPWQALTAVPAASTGCPSWRKT